MFKNLNVEYDFKKEYTFKKRKEESDKIKIKYPDRIPIIVEKSNKFKIINKIDKKKFLCPSDLTIGQFLFVIRKRLHLESSKSIFIFINGHIPLNTSTLQSIYEKNVDNDGFLYISYAGENTFG